MFLPTVVLISAFAFILYHEAWTGEKDILLSEESQRVDTQASMIQEQVDDALSDIQYLAHNREIVDLLDHPAPPVLRDVERDFIAFGKTKPDYAAVRLVNADGRELVRVDRDSHHVSLVPRNRLHDKSNSPFFTEAMKLPTGNSYISPMDLKNADGAITKPYLPMLRFAAPVVSDAGKQLGVVVLNLRGDELLKELRAQNKRSEVQFELLNDEGYWLLAHKPEDAWGFMLPERVNRRFSLEYPDIWDSLRSTEFVQVFGKEGLFSLRVIDLNKLLRRVAMEVADGKVVIDTAAATGPSWVLFSHVPDSYLNTINWHLFRNYSIVVLFLIALSGVVFWVVSIAWEQRRRDARKLEDMNRTLEAIIDGSPLAILSLSHDGRVIRWNRGAERMFGWTKEEVVGRLNPIVPDNELNFFEKVHNRVVGENQTVELDLKRRRKDDTLIDVHLWSTPITFEAGKPMEYIGIVADVTARRRAQSMMSKAQQLDTATKMARTVAHEFRQPMAALALIADLVKLNRFNEKDLQTYIERVPHLLERMNNLVDRMLNLTEVRAKPYADDLEILELPETRPERGKTPPDQEEKKYNHTA